MTIFRGGVGGLLSLNLGFNDFLQRVCKLVAYCCECAVVLRAIDPHLSREGLQTHRNLDPYSPSVLIALAEVPNSPASLS